VASVTLKAKKRRMRRRRLRLPSCRGGYNRLRYRRSGTNGAGTAAYEGVEWGGGRIRGADLSNMRTAAVQVSKMR